MTKTLSDQVLDSLTGSSAHSGPVTLADLARKFGVSSALMTSCARQLVATGAATATMASHRGVLTIHGLSPVVPN